MRSRNDIAIMAVAFIGILLSAYAITLHYAPSGSTLCHINDTFDCDKVNKSPWATLLGVPVSILGLLSYLAVFLLTLKKKTVKKTLAFTEADFATYFLILIGAMLAFQLYLTAVEVIFIKAYCIVCLGSQLCTLLLGWLGYREFKIARL
jgi:uncharacterized membrane protein